MVLTKEDYINRIKSVIGDDSSDDSISLIEDLTDTYEDLESKADDENWKAKYDELDKTWRQKYIDRFNGKVESDDDFIKQPTADDDETEDVYEAPKTYEDLFTEK